MRAASSTTWSKSIFGPTRTQVKNPDMEYVKIVDKTGKIVADNNLQNIMEHMAYQPPAGTKALGDEPILTQAYQSKNGPFMTSRPRCN